MDEKRYARNIAVFGTEGQDKLLASRVLVIGAGGLGSPVLFYLAAAGVGHIGIVDYDTVDVSNLQRQIVHTTADLGRPKAISAAEKLQALNPAVTVTQHALRLDAENAPGLIGSYDFVLECCDNFEAKYLVNDTCVAFGTPFCHGAVLGLRGEVMSWVPGAVSYRDIFGPPPVILSAQESPEAVGTLGPVAGIIGSIQAAEALKYLTGTGQLILNRILVIDVGDAKWHTLSL